MANENYQCPECGEDVDNEDEICENCLEIMENDGDFDDDDDF